ncbi:MAG: hypothetical protein LUC94_04365 [Clostridiales bacterium]|nr:hypothetical protein [Clostridiales bacterium]
MADGGNEAKSDQLIELLEIYMDLVEKQDAVIFHMSGMLRRQATELRHYKELHGFIDLNRPNDEKEALEAAMQEYDQAKGDI